MDNAVSLVQAYLRVNGYFTVVEYPVLETLKKGEYRTATDLDVLAFRFPHAGRLIPARGRRAAGSELDISVDPVMGASTERADMIVGEVKEGRAVLNRAGTDPAVLGVALVRFGCCAREEAQGIVQRLLRDGEATLPMGHQIRMLVFGSIIENASGKYRAIKLGHIVEFLQNYLRAHWESVRQSDNKDPAFGFLVTLEKALRGAGSGA